MTFDLDKITSLDEAKKIIVELLRQNSLLLKRIEELEAEVARLKAMLEPDPSTPSGSIPTYKKANKKKRRSKKPGRKKGHRGERRAIPENIDRYEEHTAKICPDCGAPLGKPVEKRKRYIEDIPNIKPEVTEHTINRYFCPRCKKNVEPKVTCALPRAQFGLRFLLITAWMHFALGMTAGNIIKWLGSVCQMEVSAGGLTQMWATLANRLRPLYDELGQKARDSAVLCADETGWRVSGKTWWLWCFTDARLAYYVIRHSRGSKVVKEILGELFNGVLQSDFFGAYNEITAWAKQRCIVHLFRELKKVSLKNESAEWKAFQKKLKRLFNDALRLAHKRSDYNTETYKRRTAKLYIRLDELIDGECKDKDVKRLIKRMRRHRNEVLTFVKHPGVSADNNRAERMIRPAVIARKNSHCNRSERGAETQAILMSVFRTLDLCDEQPIEYLTAYIKTQLTSSKTTVNTPLAA